MEVKSERIENKKKRKGDLPTTMVGVHVAEDEIVDLPPLQLHRHLLQNPLLKVVECVLVSRATCA